MNVFFQLMTSQFCSEKNMETFRPNDLTAVNKDRNKDKGNSKPR